MKMITLSVLIVVTICVSTISFAQNFEHKNPYTIFGKTYVPGEKGENEKTNKYSNHHRVFQFVQIPK